MNMITDNWFVRHDNSDGIFIITEEQLFFFANVKKIVLQQADAR